MQKILVYFLKKADREDINKSFKKDLLPDKSDDRDYKLSHNEAILTAIAASEKLEIDLSEFTKVKNQGPIGSCASHAICSAVEMIWNKHNPKKFLELSELWHYWRVRQKDYMNTHPRDSGQYIRDGLKVAQEKGLAMERLWAYDVTKYNDKPPGLATSFAHIVKIKRYIRLNSKDEIRGTLAQGHTVVLGVPIYNNFTRFKGTGIIPRPQGRKNGGHAIEICGCSDLKGAFKINNSWGKRWGNKGYAYLPYDYPFYDAWRIEI